MVTFYAYIRQTYQEKLKILFPVNEKGHLSEKPDIRTGYLEQLWRVTYIITHYVFGVIISLFFIIMMKNCLILFNGTNMFVRALSTPSPGSPLPPFS